jgi:hypothetical protein
VDTSFVGSLSSDVLRRDLHSDIKALSSVCSASARKEQRNQRDQETSMYDLLRAILEQELFLGSVYY